ncbi:MAG: hypothetical protein AAF126_03105, partial [Chloroflexota bacterium]
VDIEALGIEKPKRKNGDILCPECGLSNLQIQSFADVMMCETCHCAWYTATGIKIHNGAYIGAVNVLAYHVQSLKKEAYEALIQIGEFAYNLYLRIPKL